MSLTSVSRLIDYRSDWPCGIVQQIKYVFCFGFSHTLSWSSSVRSYAADLTDGRLMGIFLEWLFAVCGCLCSFEAAFVAFSHNTHITTAKSFVLWNEGEWCCWLLYDTCMRCAIQLQCCFKVPFDLFCLESSHDAECKSLEKYQFSSHKRETVHTDIQKKFKGKTLRFSHVDFHRIYDSFVPVVYATVGLTTVGCINARPILVFAIGICTHNTHALNNNNLIANSRFKTKLNANIKAYKSEIEREKKRLKVQCAKRNIFFFYFGRMAASCFRVDNCNVGSYSLFYLFCFSPSSGILAEYLAFHDYRCHNKCVDVTLPYEPTAKIKYVSCIVSNDLFWIQSVARRFTHPQEFIIRIIRIYLLSFVCFIRFFSSARCSLHAPSPLFSSSSSALVIFILTFSMRHIPTVKE